MGQATLAWDGAASKARACSSVCASHRPSLTTASSPWDAARRPGRPRSSMPPLPRTALLALRPALQTSPSPLTCPLSSPHSYSLLPPTAQGLDAATEMVDAHLSTLIAPHWPLPEAIAAQPGLQAAVRRTLEQRRRRAAERLERSAEQLQCAAGAMRDALGVLREAAAAYGVGVGVGIGPAAPPAAGGGLPAPGPQPSPGGGPQAEPPPAPQTPPPGSAGAGRFAPAAPAAPAAAPHPDVSHVVVFLCLTAPEIGAPSHLVSALPAQRPKSSLKARPPAATARPDSALTVGSLQRHS